MKVDQVKINEALHAVEAALGDGWSIQVALSRACGSVQNTLAKEVKKEKRYLDLLNKHLELCGRNMRYAHDLRGELYQLRTSRYPHPKKI